MGYRTTDRLTRTKAERTFAEMYGEVEKERILKEVKATAPDFDICDLPRDLKVDETPYDSGDIVLIWAHVETKRRCDALAKEGRHLAIDMDDADLENAIEKLHDRLCYGQGHKQWLIVPEEQED